MKSPPEVIEQGLFYADKSTVWNLGILLYGMIFNRNCFNTTEEICYKQFIVTRKISKGIYLTNLF